MKAEITQPIQKLAQYAGFGDTSVRRDDLGSGVTQTVKSYGVTSANDVPGRDPAACQFQGSNDGSTWTTLDTESSQSFPYRYQTNYYDISNTTPYRYYRLYITAGNSENDVQVSELGLFAN